MFKTYFGEFKSGRLQRLPFLGYAFLIIAVQFAFVFATVLAIGGAEMAIGGDLATAQEAILKSLAIPYLIIFAIFMAALLIAGMNITAKRARDIGLPGWLFVAGLIFISVLISNFIFPNLSQAISTVAGLGLLFSPSGMLKGKLS